LTTAAGLSEEIGALEAAAMPTSSKAPGTKRLFVISSVVAYVLVGEQMNQFLHVTRRLQHPQL
jgi:hypothetical protein